MDIRGQHLIRAAIDVGRMTPAASLELQRLGDEAFDAISGELDAGHLDRDQQVNALRALSLITKEFLPFRKPEVLEWALSMSSEDDEWVRSQAVHVAVWTAAILAGLRWPVPSDRARDAIRHALDLGLNPAVVPLARGYLRGEPPPIEFVDVNVIPPAERP